MPLLTITDLPLALLLMEPPLALPALPERAFPPPVAIASPDLETPPSPARSKKKNKGYEPLLWDKGTVNLLLPLLTMTDLPLALLLMEPPLASPAFPERALPPPVAIASPDWEIPPSPALSMSESMMSDSKNGYCEELTVAVVDDDGFAAGAVVDGAAVGIAGIARASIAAASSDSVARLGNTTITSPVY